MATSTRTAKNTGTIESVNNVGKTVQLLSKNLFGVIALIIVLFFAIGYIVEIFGGERLTQLRTHPLIWFLAIFPFVVLGVFSYLVANHHSKPCSPGDNDKREEFLKTFEGYDVPSEIRDQDLAIATSDKARELLSDYVRIRLNNRYEEVKKGGLLLVHDGQVLKERTSPKSGRYRVRVWLEALYDPQRLQDIKQVSYRVLEGFSQTIYTTSAGSRNFDLWLTVYGEFPIVAIVEMKDGTTVQMERYLDLPGRPPD